MASHTETSTLVTHAVACSKNFNDKYFQNILQTNTLTSVVRVMIKGYMEGENWPPPNHPNPSTNCHHVKDLSHWLQDDVPVNITFLMFAVLVMHRSHSRPYKTF